MTRLRNDEFSRVSNLLAMLLLPMFPGCGPNAYQLAQQDIARQEAELEQVQDLEWREPKVAEIPPQENLREGQQQAEDASCARLLGIFMLYQGMTQPKTYNVNVKPAPEGVDNADYWREMQPTVLVPYHAGFPQAPLLGELHETHKKPLPGQKRPKIIM